MGCGSSGPAPAPTPIPNEEKVTDVLKEPDQDPTELDDILPGYPPPSPSRRKKKDIFNADRFESIEERARSAPNEVGNSFEDLASYLTQGLQSDLEKVRAIFVWIGSKTDVEGGPSDSPNAIMSMVHTRKASYSYIFTRLCRTAEIPCVVIKGLAKSVGYDVGDDVDEVKTLGNKWNAVYVEGEWRIVFVFWAFSAVTGHSSGKYTLVEAKGKSVQQKQKASAGTDVIHFNEYYFLTDPENFVHTAMANDPAWQLLREPFNIQKFSASPHFRQYYFTNDIKLVSDFKSRLHSENGTTVIAFRAENAGLEVDLSYELFFNDVESKTPLSNKTQLERFVIMERNEEKEKEWKFHVRYPVIGVYKLTINIIRQGVEHWLCHFKLYGDNIIEDVQPAPCSTGSVGWGPNLATEKAGLSSPSQKKGIIHVQSTKLTSFKFSLIRMVSVRAELVHNDIATSELQQYVTQKNDSKQVEVNVSVPKEGEYGLRLYSKDKNTNQEKNVCNYLLTAESKQNQNVVKKRRRENVTEKNVRTKLKAVTDGNDLEDLDAAIEKFKKHKLDDKGDLEKAMDRREYLSLEKEIKDAIQRRHLDPLNKAIDRVNNSRYEPDLRDNVKEAEEVRDHLRKLDRFAHDILAMKQPTVSELHHYMIPQPPIMDVMVATYLLLGEKMKHLQEWQNLQNLMRKVGKGSLIHRVRKFDTINVEDMIVPTVQKRLRKHDENGVRLTSPAAGTFYVWATHIVTDIQDRGNRQPQQGNDAANQRRS